MKQAVLTALLVLVTAVWGWTFTVVKDAATEYGAFGFLAVRFAIAAAVMGPLAVRTLTKRTLWTGLGIGVVLAMGYLFQTHGLLYTTPTKSGLITGLFVVFAPVANRIVFRVKPHWIQWMAVLVSLIGLALLLMIGEQSLSVGDFVTVGAAACFGLHIALLDRYAKFHEAAALASAQMMACTILFVTSWPVAQPMTWPSGNVWFALVVCGLLATAAGFWIQTAAQQHLPAVRTAVILTMEPVFATFFGYLLAGDRLNDVQIAGAVLMVSAVVVAEVGPALRNSRRLDEVLE